MMGLLKYWPVQIGRKQVMFLGEWEEILDSISDTEFVKIMEPIFKKISDCLCSDNFQVAERAHQLCDNEYIRGMIDQFSNVLIPVLFDNLYRNSKDTWHRTIVEMSYKLLKLLMEMNGELFEQLTASFKNRKQQERKKEQEREMLWDKLDAMRLATDQNK